MTLRSLGGGELYGDKLVRLVYVDEAGIGSLKEEPYLVIAAVIVNADKQLREVREYLDSLVETYIPEEHRTDFFFHAMELFCGKGKVFNRENKKWTLDKRLEIAYKIAEIPKLFNLTIAYSVQDRKKIRDELTLDDFLGSHNKKNKTMMLAVEHALAFSSCALEVDLWMRNNTIDEHCLMVVEDNDTARSIIKVFQNFFQNNSLPSFVYNKFEDCFPFVTIQEDPLFQNKQRRSNPLHIADCCAYIIKRAFMGDKDYLPFLDILRSQFSRPGLGF